MSEMIERVALALFRAKWSTLEPDLVAAMWADAKDDARTADQWRDARAAIEAMRELTPAMEEAYDALAIEEEGAPAQFMPHAYRAMIDAALAQDVAPPETANTST